jgi:DNA-binding transcriptional LysR family regulator
MEYAERILGISDELDKRVAELTGAVSGPLLLGASTTVAEFILPQILGEFKARYPQVQAHMSVANSETIENRVAEHALDIGIIESPAHLPSVESEAVCEDELVLICAPGHRLAAAKSVKPQEILGEPFVSREVGSGTREFTDQYLRNCKVAPEDLNIVMELGSPEAIKGVVETGVGVAIISRTRVTKERKLGLLCPVPLEPRLIRTFSLLCRKEKFRSRLLTTFSEFATARMRQMSSEA